ncbi:Hpt domain-containing protein [Paraburkholderia terrae]|uniref:Hpt domain-containing protein n=1 Tax=Paraburkholderia terrae TaxID=311230 RepID=UPI001EE19486|nr:Hpt domain-containing protein [Paraburkholderia terrae]GJH06264.1 Hpt domain-containing protein [Paraburkholderia terrae]GJH38088.1 Hpt domain-containing protein [Paraburkholderia hospita]
MTDGWTRVLAEGPGDLQAMLLQSVRADLRAAFDALARDDASRVAYLAHRLKGSARLAGDERAVALCASLEKAAQEGDIARVRLLLMQARRAFDIALRARDDTTN